MTESEGMVLVVLMMAGFISAGVFGGLAIHGLMMGRPKRALWSGPIAALIVIVFIIVIFLLMT
ncbi:hypothetical protein [Shouchella shacheensis]|uniref:hypothetical protein n=1 Tax=Shouchella shacheensis TaxID=1649580 RepID=UPI00073FBF75|nr:hypothetical protein [Shouchella shacheensis]